MVGLPPVGGLIGSCWDFSLVYILIQVTFPIARHLCPHSQSLSFQGDFLWESPYLAFYLSSIPFTMTILIHFH